MGSPTPNRVCGVGYVHPCAKNPGAEKEKTMDYKSLCPLICPLKLIHTVYLLLFKNIAVRLFSQKKDVFPLFIG